MHVIYIVKSLGVKLSGIPEDGRDIPLIILVWSLLCLMDDFILGLFKDDRTALALETLK